MFCDKITGCILGVAVGDALGLPYEGISKRRAAKLLGKPDRFRFFFRRGMVSDDTEHTCMVAQALITSGGDATLFQKDLAKRLKWWLLGLPAGIGRATLRSLLKLWFGVSPDKSGVFSAGNGPAMRSAIIGVCFSDRETVRRLVTASSRITHTDPKADLGAFAIAWAAQLASRGETVMSQAFLAEMESAFAKESEGEELLELLRRMVVSVSNGQSTIDYAESEGWGRGVTGYVYQSVPVALHAWLSHQDDLTLALEQVILCGGDTDTTGAMVGGIVGSCVGEGGISADLLDNIREWPQSISWMRRLGKQLSESIEMNERQKPLKTWFPAILLRNCFFLIVVLFHGFRRLFPPY